MYNVDLNLFRKSSLEPEIGFGLVYFEEVVFQFSRYKLSQLREKNYRQPLKIYAWRNASEQRYCREKSATIGLGWKSFF